MISDSICQICKTEEALMETTIPLCTNSEGDKHRINICSDCYGELKAMKCPQCKSPPEEIKEVCKKEVKTKGVLEAIADISQCFLCHNKEDVITITVKSCYTKEHDIPCCASCIKKLSDSPCPVCTELKIGAKSNQHLLIFHEDVVLAGMILPRSKAPKWTVIACVEAISRLQFILFPQQAACVALENHAFHGLFIGGYEADINNLNDKCSPNAIKKQCYYIHFSGFDYLTLDEAPGLKQGRFLHQAVGYYDQATQRNIIYAIGGLCYKDKKKVWLDSCEVWGLNSTDKWEKGPSLNSARAEFSAGISGDLIYVIGGFSGYSQLVANNIEICKVKESAWQVLNLENQADLPVLVGQTTCTNEDEIWIFGGSDGKCVYHRTFLLDMKTKRVTEKAWMNYPKAAAICGHQDGSIFITAGYGAQLQTERYNIKDNIWEVVEESYNSIDWMVDEDSTVADSEHVMSTKLAIMSKFV